MIKFIVICVGNKYFFIINVEEKLNKERMTKKKFNEMKAGVKKKYINFMEFIFINFF